MSDYITYTRVRFSAGDKSDIDIKLGPGNTLNKANKIMWNECGIVFIKAKDDTLFDFPGFIGLRNREMPDLDIIIHKLLDFLLKDPFYERNLNWIIKIAKKTLAGLFWGNICFE